MKIGLLFDDRGYNGLNLSCPDMGNPGIGGTQFSFLMLQKYLTSINVMPIVYHFSNNKLPALKLERKIKNFDSVINMALNDHIDILIAQNGQSKQWYQKLMESDLKCIIWAHNYLNYEEVELIHKIENVKHIVFVSRQEYDRYIDHDIIKKSTFIYNMFNSKNEQYYRNEDTFANVTYTGSLVPAKGFHILAKAWKSVLKEVPNAQLTIIGSGRLYDRHIKLGNYGIAEEDYENKFMPYLCESTGEILPSVNFKGILGEEKIRIYQNTSVGIVNPSAVTETFGLSAVEMEACGIPIITKNKYGFLDVIKNKKTGLLFNNERQFLKYIVHLLKDQELNKILGDNAKKYVANKFAPEKIIVQWENLFRDILNEQVCKYIRPSESWHNDYKWLRLINRYIRKICPIFPPIIAIKSKGRNIIRRKNN